MLLTGTLKDYTIEVANRSVQITDAAGETDTAKGVELFRFLGDGNTYLATRHTLVQTNHMGGLEKSFDQAAIWNSIDAANNPTETDSVLAKPALFQTNHTGGFERFLDKAAIWNAIGAASNNTTDNDSVLANLKQQAHDAFEHNGGNAMDELAAWLHFTHHE